MNQYKNEIFEALKNSEISLEDSVTIINEEKNLKRELKEALE